MVPWTEGGSVEGQTACFSLPLISHLLCLDYYFGRRPVWRRCINICSQFALLAMKLRASTAP